MEKCILIGERLPNTMERPSVHQNTKVHHLLVHLAHPGANCQQAQVGTLAERWLISSVSIDATMKPGGAVGVVNYLAVWHAHPRRKAVWKWWFHLPGDQ